MAEDILMFVQYDKHRPSVHASSIDRAALTPSIIQGRMGERARAIREDSYMTSECMGQGQKYERDISEKGCL